MAEKTDSRVSLIVPVRDEGATIRNLLASVFEQSRLPDEVVIADGGSKDDTKEIIRFFIDKGYPIKLIEAGAAYPGTVRNLAILAARFDIIAMTDAGITLDKTWLEELLKPFEEDEDVGIVYGNFEPVRDTFFKDCLAIAFVPAKKDICGRKIRPYFIASSAVKKYIWEKAGRFPDLRAAEDRIFMENVKKAGARMAFAPDANVHWQIPGDFRSAFTRFSNLSFHDLKAGRARDWHLPVLKIYTAGVIVAALGFLSSFVWFVALPGLALLRTLAIIGERAEETPAYKRFRLKRILYVSLLVFWIDLAMFYGAALYFVKRQP